MYSNDFVVCVCKDGKAVDEDRGGVVRLPFGQEYTIYLKNKHSRRAVADISIDGEHMGEFVVGAHSSVYIKRPADRDAAFRFVSATSDAAKKEGKSEDDASGVITVKWSLEKVRYIRHEYVPTSTPIPWKSPSPYGRSILRSTEFYSQSFNTDAQPAACFNCCSDFDGEVKTSGGIQLPEVSNVGVTVDGGRTNQSFYEVNIDIEDTSTTMIIILRGLDVKAERKAKKSQTLAEIKKIKAQLEKLEREYGSEVL